MRAVFGRDGASDGPIASATSATTHPATRRSSASPRTAKRKVFAIGVAALVEQKDEIVRTYRAKKYESLVGGKVLVEQGHAELIDPRTIRVGEHLVRGEDVLIATGSRPVLPDIDGLDRVPYLTSDLLTYDEPMELKVLPGSMLITGGGYIALELGQMFARFGVAVTVVELGGALLCGGYEPELACGRKIALDSRSGSGSRGALGAGRSGRGFLAGAARPRSIRRSLFGRPLTQSLVALSAAFAPAIALALELDPTALSPADAGPLRRIAVTPRHRIAVLWASLEGAQVPKETMSELEALLERAGLEARQLDAEVSRRCRGEFGCIVLEARPDYRRESLLSPLGWPLPYEDHMRALRASEQPYAQHLLLLSYQPFSESAAGALQAVLVDTDRALAFWHVADRMGDSWKEKVEAEILAAAVMARLAPTDVKGGADATRVLEHLVAGVLTPVLDQARVPRRFGIIEFRTQDTAVKVAIDGRVLGSVDAGRTLLTDVTPGPHRLRFERESEDPLEVGVVVKLNERAEVTPRWNPSGPAPVLRTGLFWGGVATVAAGAALTVYALVLASGSHDPAVCLDTGSGTCGGRELVAFGYKGSGGDRYADPNSGSVPIAPLGLGLLAAGAVWSIGTALFGEVEDLPWPQLAIGLGAGIGVAGTGIALKGQSGFKQR